LIESTQKLRPFHRDIIHSGLLLRHAESMVHLGRKEDAKKILAEAELIADRTAHEHNMPARKKQVEEAKRLLGI
jgi:hypothetical protein